MTDSEKKERLRRRKNSNDVFDDTVSPLLRKGSAAPKQRILETERTTLPEHLDTPSLNNVLFAVLTLSRAVSPEMPEEEIVHAYLDTLKTLFPGRKFVVRLFSKDSGDLKLVYATGRLREGTQTIAALTKEALERHGIAFESSDFAFTPLEEYEPSFETGLHGFDVPLLEGDDIVGTLAVEYEQQSPAPGNDRAVIVPLTLQLASALRNARLLRESFYLRDYLTKLFDHANAPIIVMGKQREVRVVNRAFLNLTGWERRDVVNREFIDMVAEAEKTRLLPMFINALRGVPTSNFELKLLKRNGGFASVSLNLASVLGPDEEVEGVIGIVRDITDVRMLQEQIIQAEKLATLGQLAAGVVHELNNPLTSISVYGDYLLKKTKRDNGDSGDIEKLERIVESAERILRFSRDLVAYARPSTEGPSAISIQDVLEQAIVFCEHIIAEHEASVERNYAEHLPTVYAVAGQMHQVFINLITNACHAMPLGAGRLTVSAESIQSGKLLIKISDNGKGIPENSLNDVFEPFFSTKGEGKGTGLGLSIVKNIVEQHGGEILVESKLGTGATFMITLPCQPDKPSVC